MRILFTHPYSPIATFAQKDLSILRQVHEVRQRYFASQGEVLTLLRRGQFHLVNDLYNLLRDVKWADVTLSWSGKLNAFFTVLFSRMLHKKTIVISSGDDVANERIAGKPWGLAAHPLKRWIAYYIFANADYVVGISEFNKEEAIRNVKAHPEKTLLICHGFDSGRFRKLPGLGRQSNLVITVGNINRENYYIKGFGLLVQAAGLLPRVQFCIVGPHLDQTINLLKDSAPPNLMFSSGLYGRDLVEMMSKAPVYVQMSLHESFGCAVAEAMLCECVPVVSRRAALPEVVGDCGFYCDDLSPQSLAVQIRAALEAPDQMGRRARERIKEEFPLSKRHEKLLALIESLDRGSTK